MGILSDHSEVLQQLDQELARTSELILKYFGKEPFGFCAPGGFYRGLQGHPKQLGILWNHGHRFIRTDGVGRLSNLCRLFLPSHIGISRMDFPSCLKCQLTDSIVTYFSIQAIRVMDGNQHPVVLMEQF